MKYKAPDGHIIVSSPKGPVTYTCKHSGLTEGIFHTMETKASSSSPVGIQQIKMVRIIDEESITITITESTLEELMAYQQEIDEANRNTNIEPNPDINTI